VWGGWFTSHPKGENASLRHGCRADAGREEKLLGMVVEQSGRQSGAVEHPCSSLQNLAACFSLPSSTSSLPSPCHTILKKGV